MLLTLALGSNVGNSATTLARARALLTGQLGPLVGKSEAARTAAWGVTEQPDFLNQVIVLDLRPWLDAQPDYDFTANPYPTPAVLHRLLEVAQGVEAELGRERQTHWGPRTCDVDLIFLGDVLYEDARLSLPHPWWAARDFVGGVIRRELADFDLSLGVI